MTKTCDSLAESEVNLDVESLKVSNWTLQPSKISEKQKGVVVQGKQGKINKAPGKKATASGARPEAVPRLHHLFKAAHVVSAGPGGQIGRVLSAHYTGLVVGVAQKSVLRLTPEVKRTICKGCRFLLQPGEVRVVKQSGGHIEIRCPRCQAVKNFPLKKKTKKT